MAEISRRPWLAALLSLFGGPIGHVYAGAARRAIVLYLAGSAIALTSLFVTVRLPFSRVACFLLFACLLCIPLFYVVDAFRTTRKRQTLDNRKPYQRWWMYLIAFALFTMGNFAVAQAARTCIAEAFVIPTRGMRDTLLPGDRILVNKTHYAFHSVRRGDVAVFFSSGKTSPACVQRIIAIPGDKIEIRDETVYVNGKEIEEPYARLAGPKPPYPRLFNMDEKSVPEDHVFMLGDDRRMSKDSRIIGCIPIDDLIGRPNFIYWSTERHFRDPTSEYYSAGSTRWSRIGMAIQR